MGSGQISFTLYPRKTKSGKRIWYYRIVDASGRSSGRSTRQTSKAVARAYVTELLRRGKLNRQDPLFKDYTKDWWKWDRCRYVQLRKVGGKVHQTYVKVRRGFLEHHILPTFGEKRMSEITVKMIEDWKLSLLKKTGRYGEPLSPTTVNEVLATLKSIFSEAVRLQDLYYDPSAAVGRLRERRKRKSYLDLEEVRELFEEAAVKNIWNGNLRHYIINLLAASTGMGLGEIQGLKKTCVHDGYLEVQWAWERKFGLKEPKGDSSRLVPLPSRTNRYLHAFIDSCSKGGDTQALIFCDSAPDKPVGHRSIQRAFYRALGKIGITEEERKSRNITFQSWRHFYNSMLRGKIPDAKLRKLTGHKSERISDLYTTFKLRDYQDVLQIQEGWFVET